MFEWARLQFSKAPPRTPLSRYTSLNGALYLLLGATFYAWPGSAQVLLRAPPFQAGEEGLVQALGVTIAVIGYLYFFGARTAQDRFGVSTILDRLLMPVALVPLIIAGRLSPNLGVPFAVLDPTLALGAWIIFARTAHPRALTSAQVSADPGVGRPDQPGPGDASTR
jgi:hypothetical protein